MPGFLLEDDAVQARLGEYDSWLDERKRQAEEAKKAAASAVQATVQPVQQAITQVAQPVTDALSEYDRWVSQRPTAQPAAQPQAVTRPAPPEAPVAGTPTGGGQPSLSHAEEPATSSDTVAAPDLGGRWKTNFDFGAIYTGDYRTGTPHRGVDLVPTQGGIGAEVDAFAPGVVTNIARDSGAGGLMVYVQDDQGLTHAYMHLAGTAPGLAVGQRVSRGTPLAQMGESGTEGSPHLHYEVRKNAATGDPTDQLIDPRPYVAGRQEQAHAGAAPQPGGQPPVVRAIGQGKQAFEQTLAPLAQWFSDRSGIDPSVYLAIAANETGWGQSQTAQQQNNLFSIQGSGQGGRWAGYDSPQQAFEAFNSLISSAPRYAQAWADRHNPLQFINDLRKAGYVVDEPGYPAQGWVDQVGAIYNDISGRAASLFGGVTRPVEDARAATRAVMTSGLAAGVEQSGAVRRGAEDLASSSARTLADVQNQGAQAVTAWDQWRRDSAARAAQFSGQTQDMLSRAREGVSQFDPNVGLRQASQGAQDFAATDLGQRATSVPLPPLGGQTLGQMGQALGQTPENLATVGRGIQAGNVEAERQLNDPLVLQAVRGGAGLAGQTLSPEIEEGIRTGARVTPIGAALNDPGGVVSAMLKGGGMTTTVALPVLGDVPLADILGLASNLLIPTGAEGRFGGGALRTGLTETSRLGRPLEQWGAALAVEQGLGRAGRAVIDQATASRLAISAAGRWARASVEDIAADLTRSPLGEFMRNEAGEIDYGALYRAAQELKQHAVRLYSGGIGHPSDPARFDLGRANPESLYGPGAYMTEDPRVAGGIVSPTGSIATAGEGYAQTVPLRAGITPPKTVNTWARLVEHADERVRALQEAAKTSPLGGDTTLEQAGLYPSSPHITIRQRMDQLTREAGEYRDQLERATQETRGGVMRAYDVPQDLKLFDIDGQPTESELEQLMAYADDRGMRQTAGVIGDAWIRARRFASGPHAGDKYLGLPNDTPTGDKLYQQLQREAGLSKAQINEFLEDAGYDGIIHQGGGVRPMRDPDTGEVIRHRVRVLFQSGLDKSRNAVSGRVAAAVPGGAAGYESDPNASPEERALRTAGGAFVGATLGPRGTDDVIRQAARQLAVRSGGVRGAEATQSIAEAIARIKPTLPAEAIAAARADWAALPRVGERVAGLPPNIADPEDLAALRVHLNELVDDGVAGKDWYINSARKIRDAVGGDLKEAEKLAQLVGMMAKNVNPEQNVNYAIEAWNQWKAGVPVANVHRFSDVSRSAADLLERGIPWGGRKTNSFYINLMEELDPELLKLKKVTADIWVNRAFGYHGKAPVGQQYDFIERELRRIADERGQRPSQVQAQLWVGQMARQAPDADGAADFSHAMARRMGQVGWETAPGTGEVRGYSGATPEAQSAFNHDVGMAFLDEDGHDLVAKALGALGGHSFEAPGVWLGQVTPGWQTQIGVASTAKATKGGAVLKPASRQAIEAVAGAKGWLLSTLPDNKQNAVGWTQVFPAADTKTANAVDVNAGRLLSVSEAHEIAAGLTQAMAKASPLQGEEVPFIMTSTEHGAWLRNTSNMPNGQFHKAVQSALEGVQSDVTFRHTPVRADSGLVFNDWRTQPNGEGFIDAVRRGGREESFRSIQGPLGERIAAAQQEAAARHFGAGQAAYTEPGAAVERAVPGAADATQLGPPPPRGGMEGPIDLFPTPPEAAARAAREAENAPLQHFQGDLRARVRELEDQIRRLTGKEPDEALFDLQQAARTPQEATRAVMQRQGGRVGFADQEMTAAGREAQARWQSRVGRAASDFLSGTESELGAANPRVAVQIGATALGGVGGYATAPEGSTQQERLARGGAGALAAGGLAFGGPRAARMAPETRAVAGDVASWLQASTPSQATARAAGAALGPQTLGERTAEWISSNLLSGPGLVWNVVNQSMHLGWQPLLRAAQGHPIEALHGLQAVAAAAPSALERGWAVLARGEPYAGVAGMQGRPLAKTSVGLRANLAGDAVLRTLNEHLGGMLEAQRLVRTKGAKTLADARSVVAQNASQITDAARREGQISALTTGEARSPWLRDLGRTKTGLLRDANPLKQLAGVLLHVGMPFARVPEELLYQVGRNSPVIGQALDVLQVIKAAPGDDRQVATAKMGLNAAMAAVTIGAVLADQVRGASDKEHPNQINLDGQWLPLTSLGTLGGRMAVTAAVVDGLRNQGKEPQADAMARIAQAVNNLGKLAEQDYPLADQVRLLSRIGQGNLTGVASGFASDVLAGVTPVSGALGAAENVGDPYAREAAKSGWGDVYEPNMARIPGLAGMLPTQVEQVSGEPKLRPSSGPGALLRVQNVERAANPVTREIIRLEKLGYQIPEPKENPQTVSSRGAQVKLTGPEQRSLAQARGELIQQQLERYMNTPYWQGLTDDQKAQIMARVLNRAGARTAITWRRQTVPEEARQREAAGRRVVGRAEPVAV